MNEQKQDKDTTVQIPILNIKMMSDEEWNRLAHQNWIDRSRKN